MEPVLKQQVRILGPSRLRTTADVQEELKYRKPMTLTGRDDDHMTSAGAGREASVIGLDARVGGAPCPHPVPIRANIPDKRILMS